MKHGRPTRPWWLALAFIALLSAGAAGAGNILFIGNSFTFAFGSPVRYYRPDTVTDLNSDGQGGVPALFKSFTEQAGLSYEVYLETAPGIGLDWHLEHKLATIEQKPWDAVVMHGYSTLDQKKPGDPKVLIDSVKRLAAILKARNPQVAVRIMATWPRADQTYEAQGAWYRKPIEVMAQDVRSGYDQAAAATPVVKAVIPVGDAWVRAMHAGLAKIRTPMMESRLASSIYGASMAITPASTAPTSRRWSSSAASRDSIRAPWAAASCSAFLELGLSPAQTDALQQVAFDQLSAEGIVKAAPKKALGVPTKCTGQH